MIIGSKDYFIGIKINSIIENYIIFLYKYSVFNYFVTRQTYYDLSPITIITNKGPPTLL